MINRKITISLLILSLMILSGCEDKICDDYGCYNCDKEPEQNACIKASIRMIDSVCVEYLIDEKYYDKEGELVRNVLCFNKSEVTEYCSDYSLRIGECYPRKKIDKHFDVYYIFCNDIGDGRLNECGGQR